MKKIINNIKSDKITFRGFLFSFIIGLLTTIYALLSYKSLPPFIPIFNQLPWGEQRFTQTYGIFIPTIILGVLLIFNFIFSAIIYPKNPLISRILASITLLIAVMSFIFVIRTILVIS